MTRDETTKLLRTRSTLTSQPYGEEAITDWHEALNDRTYDDCRRALIHVAREERKITVAHVVRRVVETTTPEIEERAPRLCFVCRMFDAERGRTRCSICQAAQDTATAEGRMSPAMTAAIVAARRRGERSHGPDNSADHL